MSHSSNRSNLDVSVLLLDVEGTTTPIDFVYQVLFPYARVHMASYLTEHFDADDRTQLQNEHAAEIDDKKPPWTEPPVDYLLWLMDRDRKSRGLKSVQGKIWEGGYREGTLRSVLFPDVAPFLIQWKAAGKRTYIYSSGSVKAQQLLFAYSNAGDMTPLIEGYFDTEVGPKREATSYRVVADRIDVSVDQILFVSDIDGECAAARDAGINVLLCSRPGNAAQVDDFPVIHTFEDIADYVATVHRR